MQLRKRSEEGAAKRSLSKQPSTKIGTKSKPVKKATSVKQSPHRVSQCQKKRAMKAVNTKDWVVKKMANEAEKKGKNAAEEASTTHETEGTISACRKWLVCPPYERVSEIPKVDRENYKKLIQGPLYAGGVGPVASLHGIKPPVLKDMGTLENARGIIGWRAWYKVEDESQIDPANPNFDQTCYVVCVEHGWEDIHSGGKRVLVPAKGFPYDVDWEQRVAYAERGFIQLGYPPQNDLNGAWGRRDLSGREEMEASLKGYDEAPKRTTEVKPRRF